MIFSFCHRTNLIPNEWDIDMAIIVIKMINNIVKVITDNVLGKMLIEKIFKVARVGKQQKNHFYFLHKKTATLHGRIFSDYIGS